MSNVKNNQSADSKNAQAIDRSLLEYLKPKPEDRYSKLEAYCDLLSRAATSAYTAKVGGQPVELLPGETGCGRLSSQSKRSNCCLLNMGLLSEAEN